MTKKERKQKLSTRPYKGARDFYPEDMRIRKWLFGIWRSVAEKYGYEEYDTPLIEPFELYAAKTGDEIVNTQLYAFEDRGDRKIAIRPEKTPSVARIVAAKMNELPRPIRWFNIGSCWRYEKPQKGRGREFFQFDCDIFGLEGVAADAEVFSIPVEVMLKLGAQQQMFEIKISNRRLTEGYLKEIVGTDGSISTPGTQISKIAKAIDVKPKITPEGFVAMLEETKLNKKQIQQIIDYVNADLKFVEKLAKKSKGADEVIEFFELMEQKGLARYFVFSPEIMRGLDYYTGNVIEQFDLNPKNNRSMFGGGRYDNLVELFDAEPLPGVGLAMGDVTLMEFLKNWDLLPTLSPETVVYVTLFDTDSRDYAMKIANVLRDAGINTSAALELKKLDKQLKYADRKGIPYVIIAGPEEVEKGTVQLKDMKQKSQRELPLDNLITELTK